MNRATYWLCIAVLAAIVVLISVFSVRPPRVSEGLLIFLCVPRLHDLGKSGWWVLIPLGIELAAVVVAIAAFSTDEASIILGAMVVVIACFVIVLGLIPGQPYGNRFGEPPKTMLPFKERRKVKQTEEIFK